MPSSVLQIDFEKTLNSEQLAAVTSPFGPALVLAGAGSGKTRTLTYRVAYLLSQGVAPWQIMLLTFTNKAAHEMLERVSALTGVDSKSFWGGTFHHIGQKLLRKYGELIKIAPTFTIMDQSEAESLLNEAVKAAAGAGFLRDKNNPKIPLIAGILSLKRNTMKSAGDVIMEKYAYLEDKIDALNKFDTHYTALKRSRNLCDYDDLLELPHEMLKANPALSRELSEKFQHVLVDEYQDTNAIQSALIDMLAPHHRIMAVGDDAQCIYTWRGAQVENILSFPDRHPGTNVYKIELNYRSVPPILDAANSVFVGTGQKFEKNLRAARAGSAKPQIVPVTDGRAQAQWIVRKVQSLRSEGRSLGEMAILYRAHFHAMELQLELTRIGIPFAITSGMRFFEQAHVKDLVSQLRFVFNPRDSAAFCRVACLLPKVGEVTSLKLYGDIMALYNKPITSGVSQDNMGFGGEAPINNIPSQREGSGVGLSDNGHGLRSEAKMPSVADATLSTAGDKGTGVLSLGDAMKHPTVLARVGESRKEEWLGLSETIAELEKALKENEMPSQITNRAIEGWYSGYIRTIYPNWDSRLEDLQSLESFANRFDSFAEYLSQLVLLNSEASEKSAEAPEDALRLSTVHQAKGLEWPVVFVIGLSEGMFPSRRALEENAIDEERRLFYVALTRAQDELYLSYPLLNMASHSGVYQQLPSRFLEKLPQDCFDLVKTAGNTTQTSWRTGRSGSGWSDWKHEDASRNQKKYEQGSPSKATRGSQGISFSKTEGTFDGAAFEKQFDSKTRSNAKKLFKW